MNVGSKSGFYRLFGAIIVKTHLHSYCLFGKIIKVPRKVIHVTWILNPHPQSPQLTHSQLTMCAQLRPFYYIPPNHSYAMKGVPTFDMIDWMQDMRPFIAHIKWGFHMGIHDIYRQFSIHSRDNN